MSTITLSGGERLQAHLKKLAEEVTNGGTLRVGFLEGATYPADQGGQPVAMVAAIQEFGAPAAHIPARPFFRNMIAAKAGNWGKSLGNLLVRTGYDADKSLALMGEGIADQLQTSIDQTNTPPLAPATIAAKGFAKPLVDTGHLKNSVDFEVVK